MEIISKNNNTIKELKKQKEKNRFLLFLDTPKMVEEAINNNFEPLHIFVLKGKTFSFLKNYEVIDVSEDVLDCLSTVKNSAGIVAVFKMKFSLIKKFDGNYVVLDNVQDAGNVGAILRSALACNFKNIVLIDCAKVTNEKVVRSSAGAVLKLNLLETTKQQFIDDYKLDNLYYADMNGVNIFKSKPPSNIGIVMGNEGNGVSKEIKALCKGSLSLPMENGLESLNVAVSASIIMYQINFGGKL